MIQIAQSIYMTTIKQWAMKRLKQVSSKSWVLLNHIVFLRHIRLDLLRMSTCVL